MRISLIVYSLQYMYIGDIEIRNLDNSEKE